jgi:hypothetical protein
MNLDKTSDPYCVVRLVDASNKPVAKSSIAGFRTKHVLKTLNPVWNQQLVFHSDSGFLRAAYVHIEVWDRDVITEDTCMGEVFLPLRAVSSTQVRLSLALNWSPLMPPEYRRSESSLSSLAFSSLPSCRELELRHHRAGCPHSSAGRGRGVPSLSVLSLLHSELPAGHRRGHCHRLQVRSLWCRAADSPEGVSRQRQLDRSAR